MAYEVTAARRRPQKFEDLVGQEFVVATLVNAIAEGKVAPAYLFSGPRGCGKTSTARILAKVLNCHDMQNGVPCGVCASCVEVSRGSCLDVIEIDGASNTGVNDVRQIKDEILFPPNSCKYKIYIIDEVHMLSTNAFNALLKTIEEPPPYVIFIFATTELHKVPATIKSRCQQFHFRLGSVDQIKSLLSQTVAELGIIADDEALYWIARESTGSFRDAYTLFDQVAAFSEGNITYEKIRDKLGLVGVERLNTLCELCVEGKTAEVINFLDDMLQTGVSIEQITSNIADYLRSLLLIKNGITKEALLGQSSQRFSLLVVKAWSSVQLERALSLFLQLFRDVRYSLSPRFELELALSRLCWLSSWVSNDEVKHAVDAAKQLFSSDVPLKMHIPPVKSEVIDDVSQYDEETLHREEPSIKYDEVAVGSLQEAFNTVVKETNTEQSVTMAEVMVPTTVAPSSEAVEIKLRASCPAELKKMTVDAVRRKKMILSSSLNQAEGWTFDENFVYITVDTIFLQQQLSSEHAYISSVASQFLNCNVQLRVDLKEVVIEVEESIELPPTVQAIVDAFDGEVIAVQDPSDSASETNMVTSQN